MQIGSGSNHLPGCAPTAGGTPPAASPEPPPAPAFAPPAARGGAPVRASSKKSLFLVAGVLLLVVLAAAAYFRTGREFRTAGGADGEGGSRFLGKLASILPGRTKVAASNGVPLTAAQQRMAAELSPVRPIQETRRVGGLESARVAGGESNAAAVAVPGEAATAAVPVAVAAPPPAVVPAPVATTPAGKVKPARGTGAASATPAEKPFVWPGVRITAAIGGQQAKWIALINGRLVSVGDSVDGVSVVAISAQRVTLAAGNGQQRDFYVGSGR